MKKCKHCGEVKALHAFHRRADSKDGRQSWCKLCYARRDYTPPEEPSCRRSPRPSTLPDVQAFTLESPNKAPLHIHDTHRRLSFYIQLELHKRVKVASTLRDVSVEIIVAMALEEYLPSILEQAKAAEEETNGNA